MKIFLLCFLFFYLIKNSVFLLTQKEKLRGKYVLDASYLKKFFAHFFILLVTKKTNDYKHDMKEEPPYEINGNVIPFVGIILVQMKY